MVLFFYEYESPYPAQILLVDKTSGLLYHLQGYYELGDLQLVANSLG